MWAIVELSDEERDEIQRRQQEEADARRLRYEEQFIEHLARLLYECANYPFPLDWMAVVDLERDEWRKDAVSILRKRGLIT